MPNCNDVPSNLGGLVSRLATASLTSRDKTLRPRASAQLEWGQHDPERAHIATPRRRNYAAKNVISRHNPPRQNSQVRQLTHVGKHGRVGGHGGLRKAASQTTNRQIRDVLSIEFRCSPRRKPRGWLAAHRLLHHKPRCLRRGLYPPELNPKRPKNRDRRPLPNCPHFGQDSGFAVGTWAAVRGFAISARSLSCR